MKRIWRLFKVVLIIVIVLLLLLVASFLPDIFYFAPRARPPANVVDLQSFFAWKPDPRWAWRITVSNEVYYQLCGPAGRWLASGPSAYAFDSKGRFIGWTSDNGDFYRPAVVYAPGAKRESVKVEEVRALLTTNSITIQSP